MSAQFFTSGEGPRARSIFDRLAQHIPGMGSGQALLVQFERMSPEDEKQLAAAVAKHLPPEPAAKPKPPEVQAA